MNRNRAKVHDYESADLYLGNKHDRPLENNTRVNRRGPDIAITLHSTDVVTYHRDDSVTLDTGWWLTVTTKDRINGYLGIDHIKVYSDRGRWAVYKFGTDGEWRRFPDHPEWDYQESRDERIGWYFDGIRIAANGTILNPIDDVTAKAQPRAHRTNYTPTGYYGAMR